MNDVIATEMVKQLTRIADSLHALVAKQNQVQAPNLFRAIEDYPAFQWETEIPGCKIIARDKNGPTEVAYEGHTYRRYRSSEDDSKGIDIRYRCVVSGTVAEKNMVWASLIKFGEPKKVKPLNTAVREKIEERQSLRPESVVAQTIAVTVGATAPLPPSLYDQLAAAHSEVLRVCGVVPMQYQPDHGDKPADMQRKLDGLRAMIANKDCGTTERTPDERAAYAKACREHADLVQWAQQHQVELPAHLHVQPADDTEHIGMKIATLANLCAPSKAIAAGMRSEIDKSRQSPPTQPDLPGVKGQAMTAEQLRAWIATRVKRGDASKYNNNRERGQVVEAVNAVTGGKAPMVIRKLYNAEIDQLNSAQTLAMFEWIKPARQTPAGGQPAMLPANVNAAAELAALLSEVKPQPPIAG